MSYASYRLPAKVKKQERPVGVAILAVLGILGSLATLGLALLGFWMRQRLGSALGGQAGGLAIMMGMGLVGIWINWGLWDMVRWAWWANLLLNILSIVGGAILLRSMPLLTSILATTQPDAVARRLTISMTASTIISIVYAIIVVIYLLMVRTAFGIGVKDERPLWERR